jgi:hypothetical protein
MLSNQPYGLQIYRSAARWHVKDEAEDSTFVHPDDSSDVISYGRAFRIHKPLPQRYLPWADSRAKRKFQKICRRQTNTSVLKVTLTRTNGGMFKINWLQVSDGHVNIWSQRQAIRRVCSTGHSERISPLLIGVNGEIMDASEAGSIKRERRRTKDEQSKKAIFCAR